SGRVPSPLGVGFPQILQDILVTQHKIHQILRRYGANFLLEASSDITIFLLLHKFVRIHFVN
ncbi:hypothetical protein TSAR_002697, partial [Trichomalopsis sarcophagae]